jgi:hypothetical protein
VISPDLFFFIFSVTLFVPSDIDTLPHTADTKIETTSVNGFSQIIPNALPNSKQKQQKIIPKERNHFLHPLFGSVKESLIMHHVKSIPRV